MSSFFFGTHTLFLDPILFSTQCLARKKYEFPFFLELILFFGSHTFFDTMFGQKKSMSSFYFCFICHYVWPEESMSSFWLELMLFFGSHTFFCTMFGPKKYKWCPFFGIVRFSWSCDFFDEQNVLLSYRSRVSRN